MTRDQFVQQLAMMLRDLPRGTAADLNECMVAYWNGSGVVFAFLCERGTDAIEEEFDINDYTGRTGSRRLKTGYRPLLLAIARRCSDG